MYFVDYTGLYKRLIQILVIAVKLLNNNFV